ncbi:MAG: DUF5113 domain-containing protein [Bacteroidales bacterium]|nr:DUF5113 domain-containing protein [Candidatus Minthousia equi]
MRRIIFCIGCFLLFFLVSCSKISQEVSEKVEEYNHKAFGYRYTNLDSLRFYAHKALKLSQEYPTGLAESYNNLAFADFMQQNFPSAVKYYELALQSTNNQLEQLFSYVGLMKVYQRTSQNKKFYEYYNRANRRINNLLDELDVLDDHDLARLTVAESDFHIAASTYYYYMQKEDRARDELSRINLNDVAAADSIQWVYGLYMLGSTNLDEDLDPVQRDINGFDNLLKALFYCRMRDIPYFEANLLQTFAEQYTDTIWVERIRSHRETAIPFINPRDIPDSIISIELSNQALKLFERYGDFYQIAGEHRSLSSIYFGKKMYHEALEELSLALDNINTFTKRYHPEDKSVLNLYEEQDSLSVEVNWIENHPLYSIPQWLANIRESLSMTFSALDDKAASDYNRNVYLDIMDRTRQDKELESRFDELEEESKNMNILLFAVILLAILTVFLILWFNARWRKRNREEVARLEHSAQLCRKILSSIPSDVEDEESLRESIQQVVDNNLNIQQETKDLVQPYVDWAIQYGTTYINLAEEHKQLEKERYLHEQHIAENKCQNVYKRTCMSIVNGITPFMDRILNELRKMRQHTYSASESEKQCQYISELVDKINEYNDIMAMWIKMQQGELSLHIENFSLSDIFDTISKGQRSFLQKQQTLNVIPTNAVVKADKALTLFIVNTLAENARKYTPQGGTISVAADEQENFVEISVSDTGMGLSDEDIHRILDAKVYDSSQIGIVEGEHSQNETLRQNKGYGFGLMNCKGIIEKYRKTNPLFQVCQFNIESTLGKGSRFSFRLPKGILRLLSLLLIFVSSISYASDAKQHDALLLKASHFADSVYYCNVDGAYEEALVYADSACLYLNQYYRKMMPEGKDFMSMKQANGGAELIWWNDNLSIDYHIILDIRNEAAIAALATKQWDVYKLNNSVYTQLYKLLGEDLSLDQFCEEMQQSASNKMIAITILVTLLIVLLFSWYVMYYRQAKLQRMNVEQTLEANHKILKLSSATQNTEETMENLPQSILNQVYDNINDIHPVDGLAMMVTDGNNITEPALTNIIHLTPMLRTMLHETVRTQKRIFDTESGVYTHPLLVNINEDVMCVGAFAYIRPQSAFRSSDKILNDLILSYVAVVVYQTLIRMSHKQEDLELAEDEKRRAMHEENQLHIQNMMLDNCLSTLKHETMYYPNRIKQIVERVLNGQNENTTEQVAAMSELMEYYKEIFTILSSCATRQLMNVKLNRSMVSVNDLAEHARKYFNRQTKKQMLNCDLEISSTEGYVIGDVHLLKYMMENVVDAALQQKEPLKGNVFKFAVIPDGDFYRFSFTDPRGSYSQQYLNELFYPDIHRMQQDNTGKLTGIQYLICSQIIRDHDELNNHKGCRINAEVGENAQGFVLWFTIPAGNKIQSYTC